MVFPVYPYGERGGSVYGKKRDGSLRLGAAPRRDHPRCGSNLCLFPVPKLTRGVEDLYWIGVFLGVGVGVGVLIAGFVGSSRAGMLAAVAVAAIAGFVLGIVLREEAEAAAGAIGGILGAAATAELVRGALRRGGARAATALLVAVSALVVAALAFIPAVGYLEAVVLPILVARMRRREPERYAGLRTLARD